jgi:hypothetical protein
METHNAKELGDLPSRAARRPIRRLLCPECGGRFVTRDSRQRFCSEPCARRAYERNRRDRARDASKRQRRGPRPSPTVRLLVLERDRWMCRRCGRQIDCALTWPNPMYGSVDHIVPGRADPEALVAAHLACNSRAGSLAARAGSPGGVCAAAQSAGGRFRPRQRATDTTARSAAAAPAVHASVR